MISNKLIFLKKKLLSDCNIYCRAERGDSTAEDGRKQERSSAPYAVAYSPRGSENILGNIWDISGSNENQPLLIRLGDFRPMPAHEH